MEPGYTSSGSSSSRAQPLAGVPEDGAAVEFLRSRINYERTAVVPYGQRDFRLDRMRQLLDRLDNPQRDLKIVHIAGTKGKGSVAVMIAGALRAAGYRTGLFSSPHLDRVEERIALDGEDCPADELARLVGRLRPVVTAMDLLPTADPRESNRPTYFEIVTALALLRFSECRVDAAVLEVGMGGRLDSTNVCEPLVSVITSISYDHTLQLGGTLAEIAGEKAGIIKPRVPVVSGVLSDEPRQVVADIASQCGCRLVQLGRDFDFRYDPPRQLDLAPAPSRVDYLGGNDGAREEILNIELSLAGSHQAANAAVAIAALDELRSVGWNIPQSAIRRGLAEVRWPARIEVVGRSPTVVLDAAHNVASIEALVRVLDESFSPSPRILVFATTRDKDLRGMLRALIPVFDEVIVPRYWQNPRAVVPEELAALAAEISPASVHLAGDPATAWNLATRMATPQHLICITGSFFTAAEMSAAIGETVA
jgi:dihydrofolate synthase/folylpolyglutamate synthase